MTAPIGQPLKPINIPEVFGVWEYHPDFADFEAAASYFDEMAYEIFAGRGDGNCHSTWSIYELGKNMDQPHPDSGCIYVHYQGVVANIEGPNWSDVWAAADKAIELSGDEHHIFIEQLNASGNCYDLVTGS